MGGVVVALLGAHKHSYLVRVYIYTRYIYMGTGIGSGMRTIHAMNDLHLAAAAEGNVSKDLDAHALLTLGRAHSAPPFLMYVPICLSSLSSRGCTTAPSLKSLQRRGMAGPDKL